MVELVAALSRIRAIILTLFTYQLHYSVVIKEKKKGCLGFFSVSLRLCAGLTIVFMCLPAKDKGEKKLFGYSFVPLMQEDGRTLPDGTHELIIHKVIIAWAHS